MAEVQANNEKVQQLASDEGLKTAQNVAAGVAGFAASSDVNSPVLMASFAKHSRPSRRDRALDTPEQHCLLPFG